MHLCFFYSKSLFAEKCHEILCRLRLADRDTFFMFTNFLPNFYQTFTKFLPNFYEVFLRNFSPWGSVSTRFFSLGVFQALWFFSMWNHLAHRKFCEAFSRHFIFYTSIKSFDRVRIKKLIKKKNLSDLVWFQWYTI